MTRPRSPGLSLSATVFCQAKRAAVLIGPVASIQLITGDGASKRKRTKEQAKILAAVKRHCSVFILRGMKFGFIAEGNQAAEASVERDFVLVSADLPELRFHGAIVPVGLTAPLP